MMPKWKTKFPETAEMMQKTLDAMPDEDYEDRRPTTESLTHAGLLAEQLGEESSDVTSALMLLELTGEIRQYPKDYIPGNHAYPVYGKWAEGKSAKGIGLD